MWVAKKKMKMSDVSKVIQIYSQMDYLFKFLSHSLIILTIYQLNLTSPETLIKVM